MVRRLLSGRAAELIHELRSADRDATDASLAFCAGLTALFFCVLLCGISHHELWRDETQAWLIARDSSSIFEIFSNLRFEGHPALWHLCLYPLTRLTHDPLAMQVFHSILAAGCVFLLARFARFPRWQKVLLAFGYYLLFEYGLVSRCYSLGNLLLFAFCCLWSKKDKPAALIGQFVLLGLLANTNGFGLVISICCALALLIDVWVQYRQRSFYQLRPLLIGFVSFAFFLTIPIVEIVQPQLRTSSSLARTYRPFKTVPKESIFFVSSVTRSYLPIPQPINHFWNSNIFPTMSPVTVTLSTILFLTFFVPFSRNIAVLVLYTLGTLFLSLLATPLGGQRYIGQEFILLVCCAWLVKLMEPKDAPSSQRRAWLTLNDHNARLVFSALLIIQFAVGVFFFTADLRLPFSQSQNIANYLKEHGLAHSPIVAYPDPMGISLSALLDRTVFQLRSGRQSSFDSREGKNSPLTTEGQIIERLEEYYRLNQNPFLLVLEKPFGKCSSSQLRFSKIQSFCGSIAGRREDYYLYRVEPKLN